MEKNLNELEKHELVEAIERINNIVTRKYIIPRGRLTEIHDVIEELRGFNPYIESNEQPSPKGAAAE